MRLAALVVALAAVSACGTTVPLAQQQQQAGSQLAPAQANQDQLQQPTGADSGDQQQRTGTSPGERQQPTAVPTASLTPVSPLGPRGHSPVEVGVIVPNTNAGKAFGDVFGTPVVTGDVTAMADAMAGYVNSHGGFGGHPVKPVFYQNCLGCDLSAQDQEVCTTFTQDHHVVAVLDNTETRLGLATCLGKHGVPILGGGVAVFGDQEFRQAGNLWSPYELSADTAYLSMLDQLHRTGWFGKGKVGLIVAEGYPVFARLAPIVKARLAALGHPVQAEASMAYAPNGSSAAASTVLRFKAAGVTRVVILDSGSGIMLELAPQEASQDYYPRVSVTSLDVLGTAAGIIPPQSYEGAAGVGWLTIADGAPNRPAPTSTEKQCRQVYRAAHVDISGALAETEGIAMCDTFLFAATAYGRAPSLSLEALRSAVVALGHSYVPAGTFSTRFGPGVYGGASTLRDIAYDTGCSCFRYSGPAQPIA